MRFGAIGLLGGRLMATDGMSGDTVGVMPICAPCGKVGPSDAVHTDCYTDAVASGETPGDDWARQHYLDAGCCEAEVITVLVRRPKHGQTGGATAGPKIASVP